MTMSNSETALIWKAVAYWIGKNHISQQHLNMLFSGIRPPYNGTRIDRGIDTGIEPVSSEFLHTCVRVFNLVEARTGGRNDNLSDKDCIMMLTAPLDHGNNQTMLQL